MNIKLYSVWMVNPIKVVEFGEYEFSRYKPWLASKLVVTGIEPPLFGEPAKYNVVIFDTPNRADKLENPFQVIGEGSFKLMDEITPKHLTRLDFG